MRNKFLNFFRQINREQILLLAVSCCFMGHGWAAYKASLNFGSQWINWLYSTIAMEDYHRASLMLKIMASWDTAVAIGVWFPKTRIWALRWAFVWASMTAMSRLYFLFGYNARFLSHSFGNAFFRAINFMPPLVLLINEKFRQKFLSLGLGLCLLGFSLVNYSATFELINWPLRLSDFPYPRHETEMTLSLLFLLFSILWLAQFKGLKVPRKFLFYGTFTLMGLEIGLDIFLWVAQQRLMMMLLEHINFILVPIAWYSHSETSKQRV